MKNSQPVPDNPFSLPEDLPIPLDDGACTHLEDLQLPSLSLISTGNNKIDLSRTSGWCVVFCYPMTGRPGFPIPDDWLQIPGAAGCTSQTCSYRDHYSKLRNNGVEVYGLSTQTAEAQAEAASRLQLPYQLLSDAEHKLSSAIGLPLLRAGDLVLIKRLTLIIKDGVIKKFFYPVFPPDKNVFEVMAWFSKNQA